MATMPVTFLQEVRTELSKVVWPTRAETIRLTFVVIFVSVFIGLFIGGLDFTLTKVMQVVVRR